MIECAMVSMRRAQDTIDLKRFNTIKPKIFID